MLFCHGQRRRTRPAAAPLPKAPLLITSRLNQLRHHVLLAHGLAVQAIRARSRTGTQIGPAENISVCVPVVETPEHIAAAELAIREVDASYLTAMIEGRYREFSWRLPAWTPRRSPET